MNNYVPKAILDLIKQQAYSSGEITKLERHLGRKKAKYLALKTAYFETRNTIAEIEIKLEKAKASLIEATAGLAKIAPTLDINEIRSIEPRPKTSRLPFGEISRRIVDVFLGANGKPLTTGEICDQISERFQLPNATAKDRKDTYERISKRLRFYAGQGVIKRLHAPDHGVRMGTWVWVGLD
jgi:hypothetical protein